MAAFLESLVVEGVNKISGKAPKGAVFRFGCFEEGVSVSVERMAPPPMLLLSPHLVMLLFLLITY